MKLSISSSVQSLIDSVVSDVEDGVAITRDLTPLYELVEEDAGGECMSIWDNQIAVKMNELAAYYFTDDIAFDFLDLETPSDLTDELRLEYATEQVHYRLEEDDFFALTVHILPLVATSGSSAFLGFTMQSQGQGGPVFEWVGAFREIEAFHAELERRGNWLVKDDFDDRLNGLLAKWQR